MSQRSRLACPVCGAHRLAIVEFPEQRIGGYQPYFEIMGMGEPTVVTPPALGCLDCGAEWPSLEAFRAASGDPGDPGDPGELGASGDRDELGEPAPGGSTEPRHRPG